MAIEATSAAPSTASGNFCAILKFGNSFNWFPLCQTCNFGIVWLVRPRQLRVRLEETNELGLIISYIDMPGPTPGRLRGREEGLARETGRRLGLVRPVLGLLCQPAMDGRGRIGARCARLSRYSLGEVGCTLAPV